MQKNLLYVVTSSKYSIENTIVLPRLKEYSKKFDYVFILCFGEKKIIQEGKLIYCCGNFFQWITYIKKLKKKDIVYVKTHDVFISGLFSLIASKYYHVYLVMRYASPWVYRINSPLKFFKTILINILKPLIIKNCHKVVYNSKSVVQRKYKHNYKVIYNGVNTEIFKPFIANKPSDKLNILYIGRFSKEKGLDYLFEAVKKKNDKVNLGMVGEGLLFDYYSKKYPFATFYGNVKHNQIPHFINSYDLVILPSFVESFPNSLLEALSCGKPVISVSIWGIPEMVKEGINGFLVSSKNTEQIIEAILKFNNDKSLLITFGKNARMMVLENFEETKQLQKLSDYLWND